MDIDDALTAQTTAVLTYLLVFQDRYSVHQERLETWHRNVHLVHEEMKMDASNSKLLDC